MNGVTPLWSMIAAGCLTVGGLNLLIWFKDRRGREHLVFVVGALATAVLACFELALMHAASAGEYGQILRAQHIPFTILIVSIVWLMRLHLGAGRQWLAWVVCGLCMLALGLNFVFTPNLNFREITSLLPINVLGESVSAPIGVTNPWTLIGQLSLLLLFAFCVDAARSAWHRGERRLAMVVGGSTACVVLLSLIQTVLVDWGVIHAPYMHSVVYLCFVLVMGFELSNRVLRGVQLARDLHAVEGELRESERRMELAAQAASLGMWVWDIATNRVWASEQCKRLFGYAPDTSMSIERFRDRIHPQDRMVRESALQRALTLNEPYQFEYRILLPDGSIRWLAASGRVERDGAGQPLRMVGISIDVSQRRQAEERFRLVVEASPTGIVLAGSDGRIVLVNAETERLFAYCTEEMVGQPVEMLLPERFRGVHPGHRAGFFAAPQARAMGVGRELFARRKDGSEFPVEIGLSPIQSAEGMLVLTAIVDISARKQAESETQCHRTEMAHMTRVSTMGHLATSLAHELNQPLGAILRNAEAGALLLDHPSPDLEELRAIFADICKDDQRAGAVIERTRAMLERRPPTISMIVVRELVEQVAALARGDVSSRQVRLQVETSPGLPPVRGDRVQLQQVLLNLILNGMDAMAELPPAERRLVVRARQSSEKEVEVSVTDTGRGIPADQLARLFQPFFTTKTTGLGMGLAISRTIVESHGGRLWAENNPDRGAVVRFTLPVAREEMLS